MITIIVTQDLRYQIKYYLSGVQCAAIECGELDTALLEVKQKMRMEMGIAKGKVFTTKTGKEI